MLNLIQDVLESDERTDLRQFASQLRNSESRYLLRNDILLAFSEYCTSHNKPDYYFSSSHLGQLVYYTQEIILENESLYLIIRPKIASQEVFRVLEDLTAESVTVEELLDLRDRIVNRYNPTEGDLLELDFQPFYDYTPTIRDPKNIGKGVQFLNRFLSSKLFQDPRQWLESLYTFLSLHSFQGTQLLINARIKNQKELSDQVKKALLFVGDRPDEEPYEEFRFKLQEMGFEPGWGNTAYRVQETLEILDELIDSPDDKGIEKFISRVPMIFRIVLVSIHGWFGQEGVLGRPDTGGQVVYVLDQARSLEKQLQEDIKLAGLEGLGVKPKVIILSRLIHNADGTRCNERLEKVHGTDNAWILRVPFREFNPKMTQNWISRFEIWPYLETYAIDAEKELIAEFQGLPDFIVGNYTDGNLVAFLLARRMKVTQCNVAHALEKSKYLFSNLYWNDLEEKYHFSLQFTADLIAMNAANFVISSTYQEIVGTPDSVGQYESYKCFTM
ncbi:MAG: sucrose synthase, partial [Coleofasciculaceae cyanobacterium]